MCAQGSRLEASSSSLLWMLKLLSEVELELVVVEVVEELRYATARSLYHSHQHSDQTHQG